MGSRSSGCRLARLQLRPRRRPIPRLGSAGVALFFALSGYLITSLFTSEPRLWRFYRNRAVRLFPALAFAIVGYLALQTVLNFELVPGLGWVIGYVANWAQIGGHDLGVFDPAWSLAVEEQFYLVWPLVLLATRRLFKGPAVDHHFPARCIDAGTVRPLPPCTARFASTWVPTRPRPHCSSAVCWHSVQATTTASAYLLGSSCPAPSPWSTLAALSARRLGLRSRPPDGGHLVGCPTDLVAGTADVATTTLLWDSLLWVYLWHNGVLWMTLTLAGHSLGLDGDGDRA